MVVGATYLIYKGPPEVEVVVTGIDADGYGYVTVRRKAGTSQ